MTDAVLEEILDELAEVDPTCVKCGTDMVTSRHWRRASAAERAELAEDGYVRPGARGHCHRCYATLSAEERDKAPFAARPPSRSKASPAIVREAARTLEAGGTMQQVANKYGLNYNTLDAAYRRALRNGDIS